MVEGFAELCSRVAGWLVAVTRCDLQGEGTQDRHGSGPVLALAILPTPPRGVIDSSS
jgi:hypothetical protein